MAPSALFSLLFALAFWFSPQTVPAENDIPLEYQIKAAFLFNFAKYVEWPPAALANAETPFAIGVLGEDPFGAVLDQAVRDKKIKDRAFVVRRGDDPADLADCHIVFMGGAGARERARALSLFRQRPVLTVGEQEDFTRAGGVMSFFMSDNKVSFEINLAAAERARLKISSQLLRLNKVRITRDGKE